MQIILVKKAIFSSLYSPRNGENGISWIHRWASAMAMKESREPGEPKWRISSMSRVQPVLCAVINPHDRNRAFSCSVNGPRMVRVGIAIPWCRAPALADIDAGIL